MEDIKDKFKGLLSKATNLTNRATQGKFQGSGRRLGTAEEHGDASKRTAATAAAAAARRDPAASTPRSSQWTVRPSSSSSGGSGGGGSGASSTGQQQLAPASDFDPFRAVVGGHPSSSAPPLPAAAAAAAAAAATAAAWRRPPVAQGPLRRDARKSAISKAREPRSTASRNPQPPPPPAPPPPPPPPPAAAAGSRQQPAAAAAAVRQHAGLFDTSKLSSSELDDIETAVYNLLALGLAEADEGAKMGVSPANSAQQCLVTVKKLLTNLMASPREPKYRHLRLGNAKLHSLVVQMPGGLELLVAAGFQIHQDDSSGSRSRPSSSSGRGSEDPGFAVLLEDELMPRVAAAVQVIEQALVQLVAATAYSVPDSSEPDASPSPSSQPSPSAAAAAGSPSSAAAAAAADAAAAGGSARAAVRIAPHGPQLSSGSLAAAAAQEQEEAAPAIRRCTEVLLPVAPDTEVPEWFFDRTPTEVKAEYLTLRAQREAGQLVRLRPKQQQQQEQEEERRSSSSSKVARVRVRFPEGVCLQGMFGGQEPLSRVHEWVSNSLRSPATTAFDLVQPNRKPLPLAGRVVDAGLVPAVLLNFRPKDMGDGEEATTMIGGQQYHVPFLCDERLQKAHCDW